MNTDWFYVFSGLHIVRIDRILGCGCEPGEDIIYLGSEETPSARADVVIRVHRHDDHFQPGKQFKLEITEWQP